MNRLHILEPQLADYLIQEFDSLIQRIQQCDFQIWKCNLQRNSRKTGTGSHIDARYLPSILKRHRLNQSQTVDKMLAHHFLQLCNSGQVHNLVPFYQ